MNNKNSDISAVHISLGAISGIISRICMHPMDTIRARLQVQKDLVHSSRNYGFYYLNIRDGIGKIVKNEGFRSLYKGFRVAVVFQAPAQAVYLSGYDTVKLQLQNRFGKGPFTHFVAALFAEATSGLLWTPMEVIKQQLQVQAQNTSVSSHQRHAIYRNATHAFTTILKEEGLFKGLFKGYWVSLSVFAPYSISYFILYEKLKAICLSLNSEANPSPILPFSTILACSAVSSAFAAALTSPLDVVKTRIQVQRNSVSDPTHYKGVGDAITQMIKHEGLTAFTKGLWARILFVAPSTTITISAYEQFKKWSSHHLRDDV